MTKALIAGITQQRADAVCYMIMIYVKTKDAMFAALTATANGTSVLLLREHFVVLRSTKNNPLVLPLPLPTLVARGFVVRIVALSVIRTTICLYFGVVAMAIIPTQSVLASTLTLL